MNIGAIVLFIGLVILGWIIIAAKRQLKREEENE